MTTNMFESPTVNGNLVPEFGEFCAACIEGGPVLLKKKFCDLLHFNKANRGEYAKVFHEFCMIESLVPFLGVCASGKIDSCIKVSVGLAKFYSLNIASFKFTKVQI